MAFDFEKLRELMRREATARRNLDNARRKSAKNAVSVRNGEIYRHSLETAEAAYNAVKYDVSEQRAKLTPLLENLVDPVKRSALKSRYVDGESVRDVAYNMAYSESHMFKLLRAAEMEVNSGA